jgi:hypothetical protein
LKIFSHVLKYQPFIEEKYLFIFKIIKNMKKQLLLIAALIGFSTLISAQKTIVGTVKNDKGEPLAGASIHVKGTRMGVLTDIDGQYRLVSQQKMDTLVFSFVGHDAKEMAAASSKMDVVLNEGVLLNQVVVVSYAQYCCKCNRQESEEPKLTASGDGIMCSFRCGCGGLRINHIEKWDNPLAVTPLSNGATKLDFNVDILWRGKTAAHARHYRDKVVQYYISKSTDDVHYKLIGTSRSDTAQYFKEQFLTTKMSLGGSQFLDKMRNKADSTYYLIEGYLVEADEAVNEDKDPKRELVYQQKTTVLPSEYLKISRFYAQNASNQLELTVFSAKNEPTEFRAVDVTGRTVLTHQQRLFKQNNTLTLTCPDLPSGLYVLSVVQGEQSDYRQFMIVK